MSSNNNASDRLSWLRLILPYPGHIAQKLTDDPVIPFGYFKLYNNVIAIRVRGQNINKPSTYGKFKPVDPFVLEQSKSRFYEVTVLCEVILQVLFVRTLWATFLWQLLNLFLYRRCGILTWVKRALRRWVWNSPPELGQDMTSTTTGGMAWTAPRFWRSAWAWKRPG